MFAIRLCALAMTFLWFATAPRTAFSQPVYSYKLIDFPGAAETVAAGVNDAGQIVGYYTVQSVNHGFTLFDGVFTTVDYPDSNVQTQLIGINDCGAIMGHISNNSAPQAVLQTFVLNDGYFSVVNYPGSIFTLAGGMNNRGVLVGNYSVSGYAGFAYSHGEFFMPPNLPPYPNGLNDEGDAVGYYCPGNPTCVGTGSYVGFLYRRETATVTPIRFPGAGVQTLAAGINNSGEVTGFYYPPSGNTAGFLYAKGVYTTIAVPGASGTLPYAINNAGVIVGLAGDASGGQHGFVAAPNAPVAATGPKGKCEQ